jgi:hypothetical protein
MFSVTAACIPSLVRDAAGEVHKYSKLDASDLQELHHVRVSDRAQGPHLQVELRSPHWCRSARADADDIRRYGLYRLRGHYKPPARAGIGSRSTADQDVELIRQQRMYMQATQTN